MILFISFQRIAEVSKIDHELFQDQSMEIKVRFLLFIKPYLVNPAKSMPD